MWITVALIGGFTLGLLAALALRIVQAKTGRQLAEELLSASEAERRQSVDSVVQNVKQSFGDLALEALSRSSEQFLALAKERLVQEREAGSQELDSKKQLIDQQLGQMGTTLEEVQRVMRGLETDRERKFGELTTRLQSASEQTAALTAITSSLREALSSTKARGQWGERMAEDVLRLAGFVEGVNYQKQVTIGNGNGGRPDFTFLLPRDLRLNMDVKFPFNSYLRFLEAGSEIEHARHKKQFLADVRSRMKEITDREYINPDEGTCDYVVLFIPNEALYSFIHEHDPALLDEAIRNKVIPCSPVTLFGVLAVIRQAVDQFALERTSNEVLSLFGVFQKQWAAFVEQMGRVGKRLEDTQKEFEALSGTRRRQLERPLGKIEELRGRRGLPVADLADEELVAIEA